jgi:polysaccharide chain length determinant protein (PEP-CTERM system associated)
MQEVIHQAIDELQGAARYKWPALLLAWAMCLIGWLVVMALPSVYESRAKIFADTRTALSPVIQGLAIQQDVSAQLNYVQQSLLSEAQIAHVIDETDMAADAKTEAELLQVIEKLRARLSVEMQRVGDWSQPGGSIYVISYRDPDRERSRKVVDILLTAFVENTKGGKRDNSEQAQKFLAGQLQENETRLREAEQRLAAFKKENVGTMPGAEGDYFTRLQNELDANKKARTALSIALSRQSELSRQLREGASSAADGAGRVILRSADGRPASSGDTAGRLEEARQKLADLLGQYTEKHPKVAALREEIAELEARRASELDALRRGDPEAVAATGASANPVYQSIQLALNEVGVEIASLRGEVSQHEQKIAELRQLVQTVPEVEAEFARLNRDYDSTKAQYLELLSRMQKAKLGQDAESSSSGVVLEVLDPPTASLRPVAPKRPLLILGVFVASLMAAAALAFVLSRVNPVFNHTRELELVTGREVLGVVSLTNLEQVQAEERQSYRRFAFAGGGLAVAFVAVLLISRSLPGAFLWP